MPPKRPKKTPASRLPNLGPLSELNKSFEKLSLAQKTLEQEDEDTEEYEEAHSRLKKASDTTYNLAGEYTQLIDSITKKPAFDWTYEQRKAVYDADEVIVALLNEKDSETALKKHGDWLDKVLRALETEFSLTILDPDAVLVTKEPELDEEMVLPKEYMEFQRKLEKDMEDDGDWQTVAWSGMGDDEDMLTAEEQRDREENVIAEKTRAWLTNLHVYEDVPTEFDFEIAPGSPVMALPDEDVVPEHYEPLFWSK